MIRDEFKKEIKPLFDVYGSKINMTQAAYDIWFVHLGGYDPKVLRKAINDHIGASSFPPMIADLKKLCEEQMQERRNMNKYINAIWQHIVDCRPDGEATDTARKCFDEYLETYGDKRLDGANKVYRWVEGYTGEKSLEEMMKALCEKSKNQS